MGHPLINLFLAHQNGRDVVPHRPAPPGHLCDDPAADDDKIGAVWWRFMCECGYSWRFRGSAVWDENDWRSPKRPCLGCHKWQRGDHAQNHSN